MRSPTDIPQNVRSYLETQFQPRPREVIQSSDTVTAPDIRTLDDGQITVVKAVTETRAYIRAGNTLVELSVV